MAGAESPVLEKSDKVKIQSLGWLVLKTDPDGVIQHCCKSESLFLSGAILISVQSSSDQVILVRRTDRSQAM